MIGQTISHYRILDKLGEGGMGIVYKAEDIKLRRAVALKFLPPHAAENRERFLREAQAAAALNHPHICTIHEIDEEHGFLAMELMEGQSVRDKIAKRPLRLDEALDIATQVCHGLQAAHEKAVVHRDVKPANLMFSAQGQVKITDFGLAQVGDRTRITKTGSSLGTPAYMSPEQARGETGDRRTDIWSLGVVLYEMVTGRLPFPGDREAAVAHAILHVDPEPPTALRSGLPVSLDRVIAKALAKPLAERYQHVDDMLVDLRMVRAGVNDRRGGEKKRRLLPWAIAGIVLVLGTASNIYYSRIGSRSSEPNQNWNIRPITSLSGIEWGPTWSPDGSLVGYSHSGSGNMDIYVMPATGGDPVRLTTDLADDVEPRWSPDGRYLAFLSDRGSGANVYLIPPLGGAERKLTETRIPAIERFGEMTQAMGANPWSPDGQALLFPRVSPGGQWTLWKVEVGTGKETQMTRPPAGSDDKGGSWSFDGSQIVFDRRQGGRTSLWLLPAAGGEPRVLLDDRYTNDHQPSWSSDNKRIVFASLRAGPLNLWDVDIASGRLRALTSGPGRDQYPVVSGNGRLAYANWNHQTDLYLVDLRSRNQQRLTSHTGENFNPRSSPDGKQIAYQSSRTGNNDIWLLNLETRAERQLTNDPGDDRTPDWSPDGKEIVFLSNRAGGSQVWAMNVDGGNLRRLSNQSIQVTSGGAQSATSFSAPRWSLDGRSIGYLASSDQGMALWTVDPDGKNSRTRLFGAFAFDWYRDSRHIVYTRLVAGGSGDRETILTDLESGQETVLHKGPTVELTVSRDGSALAYCYAINHVGQELYVLRLARAATTGLPHPAGEPERITKGEGNWHVHGPSWAADGKAVVYTRDTDQGDIYEIENYR